MVINILKYYEKPEKVGKHDWKKGTKAFLFMVTSNFMCGKVYGYASNWLFQTTTQFFDNNG